MRARLPPRRIRIELQRLQKKPDSLGKFLWRVMRPCFRIKPVQSKVCKPSFAALGPTKSNDCKGSFTYGPARIANGRVAPVGPTPDICVSAAKGEIRPSKDIARDAKSTFPSENDLPMLYLSAFGQSRQPQGFGHLVRPFWHISK